MEFKGIFFIVTQGFDTVNKVFPKQEDPFDKSHIVELGEHF